MVNNLDKIVIVSIDISSPIVDSTSFDNLLIVGPAPAAAGHKAPRIGVYASLSEVTDIGYVAIGDKADAVGVAARIAFSQSPSPSKIYIATVMELSDMNFNDAAPAISGALSSLSGDKVERMLKELLINNKNISFDDPETGKTTVLTENLANELFCVDTQEMFILAFEVIKLNFNSFFKKLGAQFGPAFASLTGRPSTEATASLT